VTHVVEPVPPVTASDIAGIPVPFEACPTCGYLGIRPARFGDGAVPGASEIMSERICPRCSYRGLPVEFDEREDYVEFVDDLQATPSVRE
jgi:hypothetical protein